MARDAKEKLVELLAALGVERREEVVLDLLHDLAQAAELRLPVGGQRDGVAAAVVRVAAALDQVPVLEAVEEADELAPVELQGVRDRRLRRGGALGQEGQHAVVVEAGARRLELLDGVPLDLE